MNQAFFVRWTRRLVVIAGMIAAAGLAFAWLRARPQDLPWTPLRLDQPIGLFTGRKLASLTSSRDECLALLGRTGLKFEPLPPAGSGQCLLPDRVRLAPAQDMLSLSPASVAPSCPVVAALALWNWQVVQPAAQAALGTQVRTVEHLGSFSCRPIYGRKGAAWSEHATADAIDVAGFVLADGRRISVLRDWDDAGDKGLFLRMVRDGACRVFSTVLSPEYNAAHRDHLHMDQAERGSMGARACR